MFHSELCFIQNTEHISQDGLFAYDAKNIQDHGSLITFSDSYGGLVDFWKIWSKLYILHTFSSQFSKIIYLCICQYFGLLYGGWGLGVDSFVVVILGWARTFWPKATRLRDPVPTLGVFGSLPK